ncbi:putative glycogen debranching enzyme, archaeal type [Anaerohalosphaera lusitana]|uniref:Putative glycogen debranching enzyme, archaeal type n=1 Tax=Anaerohalosphaera lusitana TaxID=1936003 RepID=A0A1U9NLY0_9BACT|nr:amylo-alpha-1,6-glucosidase [Anaerohalosphaera lusitana]AQT68590.1 putative glycogen debranching enzyme, archaeal type [Anaerohalosphaera lusitana]
MLTLKHAVAGKSQETPIWGESISELLEREWLLTNSRGGFSSGTLAGCNTRRYHALLTGTLTPPANRIVSLSNCLETIRFDGREHILSTFEFDGAITPRGHNNLTHIERDTGIHFVFDLDGKTVKRSIYLNPDMDQVAIVYDLSQLEQPAEFELRPLIALRDFHAVLREGAQFQTHWANSHLVIRDASGMTGNLVLSCENMQFDESQQWWYNFLYRKDRERGQEYLEDLWSPGVYSCTQEKPGKIVFWASLSKDPIVADNFVQPELEGVLDALSIKQHDILSDEAERDQTLAELHLAADQFVVERLVNDKPSITLLAGYPWFLDWGRDAFIALPGLLLSTERLDDAKNVLETFAHAVSEGMVPNRFDDYGGEPHYNSIDASLWFVNACFEYLRATNDRDFFASVLLDAVLEIVEGYRNGTRFGIHSDEDALLCGGDEKTQLTWMDAKCGGIAFTPRYGKAVEVNALWYNALCSLAEFFRDSNQERGEFFGNLAETAGENFESVFWNESLNCLNDCILPDGKTDASLRPNQIYAVSLFFSPLDTEKQKAVVNAVERELWTPYGLRTLAPEDSRYKGTYEGDQMQRDCAYHQGTVWPHLIGPFLEAYLKVNDFSKESVETAGKYLQPLMDHFNGSGCIGSISEIFDGDEPHAPRGCFAQGWAVAEVLRLYKIIRRHS